MDSRSRPERGPEARLHGGGLCLAAVATVVLACVAQAGTICGTLRDAVTLTPIPRAGVFVRWPAGAYTGYYAATDSVGQYCVEGVPTGTYDLEFRVDDYQTAYVRNVVVTDDVTGVDANALPGRILRAWPNPAREQATVQFESLNLPATLEVFDAFGRFVRGWRVEESEARVFTWSLRDARGSRLSPGVYFLRLKSSERVEMTRLTVVP